MTKLYRTLLYLYPAGYRREFGEEMASVFSRARQTVKHGFLPRAKFWHREVAGLLCGAAREHFLSFTGSYDWNSSRRLNMRRFPRSTIVLMIVILIGVALTMEKARAVQVKYDGFSSTTVWDTFPGFFTFGFGVMLLAAITAWAILFALRRSGMHRLSNVQTWQDHE